MQPTTTEGFHAEFQADLTLFPSVEATNYAQKFWDLAEAISWRRRFMSFVNLLSTPFENVTIEDPRDKRDDRTIVSVWQAAPLDRKGSCIVDMNHHIQKLEGDVDYAARIYALHRRGIQRPILTPRLRLDGLFVPTTLQKEKSMWMNGVSFLLSCTQRYYDAVIKPNTHDTLFTVQASTPMHHKHSHLVEQVEHALQDQGSFMCYILQDYLPTDILEIAMKYQENLVNPEQHQPPSICLTIEELIIEGQKEVSCGSSAAAQAKGPPIGLHNTQMAFVDSLPQTLVTSQASSTEDQVNTIKRDGAVVGSGVSTSDIIKQESTSSNNILLLDSLHTIPSGGNDEQHTTIDQEIVEQSGENDTENMWWDQFPEQQLATDVGFTDLLNSDSMFLGSFDVQTFPRVEQRGASEVTPASISSERGLLKETSYTDSFNKIADNSNVELQQLTAEVDLPDSSRQNGMDMSPDVSEIQTPLLPDFDFEDYLRLFDGLQGSEMAFQGSEDNPLVPMANIQTPMSSEADSVKPSSQGGSLPSGTPPESDKTTPQTSMDSTPDVMNYELGEQHIGKPANQSTSGSYNTAQMSQNKDHNIPGRKRFRTLRPATDLSKPAAMSSNSSQVMQQGQSVHQSLSNTDAMTLENTNQENAVFVPEAPFSSIVWNEAEWAFHTPPYSCQYSVFARTKFPKKEYRGAVPKDPQGRPYIPEEHWAQEYVKVCSRHSRLLKSHGPHDGYTNLRDMEIDGYIRRKTIDLLMNVRGWIPPDYVDLPHQWQD